MVYTQRYERPDSPLHNGPVRSDMHELAGELHNTQHTLTDMAVHYQVTARAVKKHLKYRDARSAFMSPGEKSNAAAEVSRGLRRASMALRWAAGQIGGAGGVVETVFARQRRDEYPRRDDERYDYEVVDSWGRTRGQGTGRVPRTSRHYRNAV